ncbi:hypothetical protein B0A55_11845, partial [Friedmanniomyces simplex]
MSTLRPLLWQKARDALRPKDKDVIPPSFMSKPEELIVEIEKYSSQSKGKPIKLPNGESFFVRDVLEKVSRWVKKFVEVGDIAVQYDPGHAALPWALVRLILQMSMNSLEKHAAVLEGIERMSYYLVWSRIEESYLIVPSTSSAQLEGEFIQLYTVMLTFMARSIRFLRNKPRIAAAFLSSDSKFHIDVDRMAIKKQSIESYTRQISDRISHQQSAELLKVRDELAELEKPVIRVERAIQSASAILDRNENQCILDWASEIPFQKHFRVNAIERKKLLPTETVNKDLLQKIEESLRNGAAGMFRWVELQIKFLCTLRKRSILLERLDKLPPGLEQIYEDLYEQNMKELGEEQAEVVKRILSWLLIAHRPLHTSEMCELVCAPEEPDMSNETVLDMCFDLVRLNVGQDQFRFSHS